MNILNALLNSYGEVLFQSNPIFGLAIIVGLAVFFPMGLLYSLIAGVASIVTANLLHINQSVIEGGVSGYNAILFGLMVGFLVKDLPQPILITIIGSTATTIICYYFMKNNLYAFAAPYVIVALIVVFLFKLRP